MPRCSSASKGGLLFEKGGDALARDTEEFCDGLDGEPFGSKRQRFGCSELGAGGLESGQVDRQEFDHPGGFLFIHEIDEAGSGLESLPEVPGSVLQLAAPFDIALGRYLDVGQGCEESLGGRIGYGH